MIAAGALLFQGVTEAVAGAEFGRTAVVPDKSGAGSAAEPAQDGAGSVAELRAALETAMPLAAEANAAEAPEDRSRPPSVREISQEDAAYIGAEALRGLFGVRPEELSIEWSYLPAGGIVPRARWHADVSVNGERRYAFSVDSVTGELLTIAFDRVLAERVPVDFDPALDKDPGNFVELAVQLAERHGIVHGKVQSAQYAGQGYSNNDPTISVEVAGESGETTLLTFSRYDRTLRGISFHPEYAAARQYSELMMQLLRLTEQATSPERGDAADSHDGPPAPVLKAIELE